MMLLSKPGIKRDGTAFDSDYHRDGQWVRWHRGRARKIGGYQKFSQPATGIPRGMNLLSRGGINYLHVGTGSFLQQFQITDDDTIVPAVSRTPAALATDTDDLSLWSMATQYDAITGTPYLIAHRAPNLRYIDSSTKTTVWAGQLNATGLLTAVQLASADFQISGCVFQIGPYTLYGDNDGQVYWSVVNHPTDVDNTGSGVARPTYAKIIAGRRIRGAGTYAGLMWSLDTLVRVSFAGGTTVWNFDEIATTCLLGPQAVIEADGVMFWPDATGRFMLYNGMPQELPNPMNLEYFFEGLNWDWRGKVFGFYNAKWGELWWCYPRGDATECTHAVIYNLREQTWYDTPLPDDGRSCATQASLYRWPIMGTATLTNGTDATLWRHEVGKDAVGTQQQAIRSFVETGDFTLLRGQQPSNDALSVEMIEPDMNQSGDLTLTILGNKTARDEVFEDEETWTFAEDDTTLPVKSERRQMRFRWESNTLGGDFEMGQTVAHVKPTMSGVND